ncbi:hypothetical protein BDV96DRAFT_229104 [Lophiotrema nucula]|uniref:Uncharacterized protein n=1 Tax=Lophiotrema nucula TaxID=690887 RepID=A0A6A5YUT8_9PLEO|nr:hypothetical protein BDV96DRAFT_229104 [Lophiotrema nucula]
MRCSSCRARHFSSDAFCTVLFSLRCPTHLCITLHLQSHARCSIAQLHSAFAVHPIPSCTAPIFEIRRSTRLACYYVHTADWYTPRALYLLSFFFTRPHCIHSGVLCAYIKALEDQRPDSGRAFWRAYQSSARETGSYWLQRKNWFEFLGKSEERCRALGGVGVAMSES